MISHLGTASGRPGILSYGFKAVSGVSFDFLLLFEWDEGEK
jgi:hypothetical protein